MTLDTHAPVAAITSPTDGLITNHNPATVAWTVDSLTQTTQLTENLTEGSNTITRMVTDAAGNTGTASVHVTLDTHAPVVAITSPIEGSIFTKADIAITWTVDGIIQSIQTTAHLNVGANTIIRSFTDLAGNIGSDTIHVMYNTECIAIANTNLLISSNNFNYENRSLCITNSNVTIEGFHIFDTIRATTASIIVDTGFSASNVELISNSTLTHKETTTSQEYGLKVVSEKMLIDNSSKIDVVGKGYAGDKFINGSWQGARTLNNAIAPISTTSSSYYACCAYGGSHGGLASASPMQSYGSVFNPNTLGSGGGVAIFYANALGGNGGGRIWIEAKKITLNGSIIANGSTPLLQGGAGGAGG